MRNCRRSAGGDIAHPIEAYESRPPIELSYRRFRVPADSSARPLAFWVGSLEGAATAWCRLAGAPGGLSVSLTSALASPARRVAAVRRDLVAGRRRSSWRKCVEFEEQVLALPRQAVRSSGGGGGLQRWVAGHGPGRALDRWQPHCAQTNCNIDSNVLRASTVAA